MSDEQAPPQSFQLHLSTISLLVLMAGVLLWAQLRQYSIPEGPRCLGWPFPVIVPPKGEFEGIPIIVFDGVFCLIFLVCTALLLETLVLYREIRKT